MANCKASFPVFDVELDQFGHRSLVRMNGEALSGVREITVSQKLGGSPVVTIQFVARSVNRRVVFDPDKEPA